MQESAADARNGATGALHHSIPVTLALDDVHFYKRKDEGKVSKEVQEEAVLAGVSCAFKPNTVTAVLCSTSAGVLHASLLHRLILCIHAVARSGRSISRHGVALLASGFGCQVPKFAFNLNLCLATTNN